jgi:hypothetical protein
MRRLSHSKEGGGKAQVVVGPTLVLAYQVVPGVESLPRVPGTARGLSNMEARGL